MCNRSYQPIPRSLPKPTPAPPRLAYSRRRSPCSWRRPTRRRPWQRQCSRTRLGSATNKMYKEAAAGGATCLHVPRRLPLARGLKRPRSASSPTTPDCSELLMSFPFIDQDAFRLRDMPQSSPAPMPLSLVSSKSSLSPTFVSSVFSEFCDSTPSVATSWQADTVVVTLNLMVTTALTPIHSLQRWFECSA
jgi:hypothetical protein